MLKNEQGSTLLLTIVVTFVLLFLGGALTLHSLTEIRQAQKEEYELQAYYLARSGADIVAQAIINDAELFLEFLEINDGQELDFGHIPSEMGSIIAAARVVEGDYRITSTGTFRDASKTMELLLRNHQIELNLKQAIFAAGDSTDGGREPVIKLEGGAHIEGDVVTNTTRERSIQFVGGTWVDGNLYVGPGGDPEKVVEVHDNGQGVLDEMETLLEAQSFPPVVFPELPTNLPSRRDFLLEHGTPDTISADGHYDTIKTTGNRKLKIDVGFGERKIRVRNLELGGPIELINVGDNGRLILYVEESISKIGCNPNINYPGDEGPFNISALTLYYAGTKQFWNEQFKVAGNIVVKEAPVFIGQGVMLRGSLITGGDSVTISGGANATEGLIYAPGAKVVLENGGASGAVVARSLHMSGGTSVRYSEEHVKNSPIDLIDPNLGDANTFVRESWSRAN